MGKVVLNQHFGDAVIANVVSNGHFGRFVIELDFFVVVVCMCV